MAAGGGEQLTADIDWAGDLSASGCNLPDPKCAATLKRTFSRWTVVSCAEEAIMQVVPTSLPCVSDADPSVVIDAGSPTTLQSYRRNIDVACRHIGNIPPPRCST